MFNEKIKNNIIQQCGKELAGLDISRMVDLYGKLLDIKPSDEELAGVSNNVTVCVKTLFSGSQMEISFDGQVDADATDQAWDLLAGSYFNAEAFLKKILCLTDPQKYYQMKQQGDNSFLFALIELGIIGEAQRSNGFYDLRNPDEFKGSNRHTDHIARVYGLRNVTAHMAKEWDDIELAVNKRDVMITCLWTCWKYKEKIEEAYNSQDINDQYDPADHISRILAAYKAKNLEYVPLKWHKKVTMLAPEDVSMSIKEIKASMTGHKHMMLVGLAGCGKTTAVDYLEYLDAKERKAHDKNPIPVKISLKDVNSNWLSVEDAIADTLDVPGDLCERMLDSGSLNVYLDGVNEMITSREVKQRMVTYIEEFLIKYPKTFVMITDRENVEIGIDADLPIYLLGKISDEDVKTYLQAKLPAGSPILEKLVDYTIRQKEEGVNLTPQMMDFVVECASTGEGLPEDSLDFSLGFIKYLLSREYKLKNDFHAAPGRLEYLLMYLAVQMTNMDADSLDETRVMHTFRVARDYMGLDDMDCAVCLKLAEQLGILEEDHDNISFSNPDWEDCLFAVGMEKGMEEWN